MYKVTFGASHDGKQSLTLRKDGHVVLRGKTGRTNAEHGVKLYAGVRDDPFFFDLTSFLRWRDPDGDGAHTYTGPTTFDGVDFFKGANVSTIVLELPDSWLGKSANFWATTYKGDRLIDRMGKPALATVFMNPFGGDDQKDPYNRTPPRRDVSTWGAQFTAVLDVFNSTPTAEAISGLLLPDVLHLDVRNLGKSTGTSFTGDKAGNILNGRTLAEDVIDLEIFVVTGGLEGTARPHDRWGRQERQGLPRAASRTSHRSTEPGAVGAARSDAAAPAFPPAPRDPLMNGRMDDV